MPTWLGDCVMTTPSIENLLESYDNPEITIIGPEVSIKILSNHPCVVESIVLKKQIFSLIVQAVNLTNFDIFISFRSSLRTKLLSKLIKAKKKYQFNKRVFRTGHQVEKYNYFVNHIINKNTLPGNLILYSNSHTKKFSKKVVGINPGASYGSAKRWTSDGFSELAFKLSKNYHVLIFGSIKEIDLGLKIENYLKENNISNFENLCGKTTIDQLIHKIEALDLFITGDSGPMHIAAAFKIPTISIFGPTKSTETAQWKNTFSRIVTKNLDCQPCMKRACPLIHHNCMKLITSEEVLEESVKLIRTVKVNQMT